MVAIILKNTISFFLLLILSCSRWEYDDSSSHTHESSPQTYLTLIAVDTLYSTQDSTGTSIFLINEEINSDYVWDTLTQALTTITSSRQELHWWGEDLDGEVIGYKYKWSSDSIWTYTSLENGVFYVPIRSDLDVFSFAVKAIDNDGNEDETPSRITLPIKNSFPEISFRYLSNPLVADIGGDTSFTFPTRTFVWDLYDQDGNETITDVFFTINDTCDTCWQILEGNETSVTLTGLASGSSTFFVKCRDIAGAESYTVQFPDSSRLSEAQTWIVKPIQGDILIVDDYPLDNANNALDWYSSMMDTLVGSEGYSFWEIGDELPYSSTDVISNLRYFKTVIWYAAYNNTASANDTYNRAEASLVNFVMSGGHLFINPIDFEDTTFTWFPIESLTTLNPNGRLFPGTVINSSIDTTLNLAVSSLIAVRVKGFLADENQFETFTNLYSMPEQYTPEEWNQEPNICSIGQFKTSPTELSGKIVMMTLPLHDGYRPKLQGNGSSIKLFQYLFDHEF